MKSFVRVTSSHLLKPEKEEEGCGINDTNWQLKKGEKQ